MMSVKTTPLTAEHEALDAKLCPFAGYNMPIHYADGIKKEHLWVREQAGIFDVSHMGQVILKGTGVTELLSRLTPSNFATLTIGKARYTVLTNEQGGIMDDLIAVRTAEEEYAIVFNAACKEQDSAIIMQALQDGQQLIQLENKALIAVQGPEAEQIVAQEVKGDIKNLEYMSASDFELKDGTPVFISRTGYTGEDGFEISVPGDKAVALWNALLSYKEVKPIGLGARDSLRLEAGYPLYGHDLTQDTTPIEAGLGWVVSKDHDGFTGAARIVKEKAEGPAFKRVGIRLKDKGIAREEAQVMTPDGEVLGSLTSGGFSPTLQTSIGMAYLPAEQAAVGTLIAVDIRGRRLAAEVVSMPFVPYRTKKPQPTPAAHLANSA